MTLRARMTAFAASAALAVAGAAPAQAEPDARDIIALLAALAAIGIIANAGNGNPAPPAYHPVPQPYPNPPPLPRPHPVPPPVVYRLPGQCLVKVQTKFGWERAYDSDCLWRAGYHRALPQQCARGGRHGNRWTEVYAEYCLRQHGY